MKQTSFISRIHLGYADGVEGLRLELLRDVRNGVGHNHGPPVKRVLHSLRAESHGVTSVLNEINKNNFKAHTHLEQFNQSTECFDGGLCHGALHRHVHVHGCLNDRADAVSVQDSL